MRSRSVRFACVAVLLSFVIAGSAEERQSAGAADPRVSLKPGLKDAGQAARNLELVASMWKPEGFFDPKMPAGEPTPPEKDPKQIEKEEAEAAKPGAKPDPRSNMLSFANSDLAFSGNHLFMGSFHGFNIYDVANPR